jgi:RNA polymerase sigma-70 factor (ECF subfamily)
MMATLAVEETLRSLRSSWQAYAPAEPPSPSAPPAQATETVLLAKLRAGDEDAYEILVRTYGGRLLSVARRLLRDEEDARDAVQDALMAAFRALPRFKGDSRLSTWMHRIVVNAALMKLRTRRRKQEESIEPLLPTFSENGRHAVPVTRWENGADLELEREETRDRVRAAIQQLPESYRTVILLRDIEELDTAEAASALGISITATKIRLHRARQALRTLLTEQLCRPADARRSRG